MAAVNLGTGVTPDKDAEVIDAVSGVAAIAAGQNVHEDPTDNTWKLASTGNVTTPRRTGIALGGVSALGAPFKVQIGGRVKGTATLVVGTAYYTSDTPGSVGPEADLGTGDYVTYYGVADTTTSIKLHPHVTGVQKA